MTEAILVGIVLLLLERLWDHFRRIRLARARVRWWIEELDSSLASLGEAYASARARDQELLTSLRADRPENRAAYQPQIEIMIHPDVEGVVLSDVFAALPTRVASAMWWLNSLARHVVGLVEKLDSVASRVGYQHRVLPEVIPAVLECTKVYELLIEVCAAGQKRIATARQDSWITTGAWRLD